jgi:hypothetical protein
VTHCIAMMVKNITNHSGKAITAGIKPIKPILNAFLSDLPVSISPIKNSIISTGITGTPI